MRIRREFRNKNDDSGDSKVAHMTQGEYEDLKLRLEEKRLELDKASSEIGEATEQSSETWHDNAPFDAAVENVSLLNGQYKSMLDLVNRAVVISGDGGGDQVVFGKKVEILINNELTKTFLMGGISDPAKGVISASSPIGEAIMGKKAGEEGSFVVGSKTSIVKILKILN